MTWSKLYAIWVFFGAGSFCASRKLNSLTCHLSLEMSSFIADILQKKFKLSRSIPVCSVHPHYTSAFPASCLHASLSFWLLLMSVCKSVTYSEDLSVCSVSLLKSLMCRTIQNLHCAPLSVSNPKPPHISLLYPLFYNFNIFQKFRFCFCSSFLSPLEPFIYLPFNLKHLVTDSL